MSMDNASAETSGLLNIASFGDACDGKWGDVDRSPEAWDYGESWWASLRDDLVWVQAHKL